MAKRRYRFTLRAVAAFTICRTGMLLAMLGIMGSAPGRGEALWLFYWLCTSFVLGMMEGAVIARGAFPVLRSAAGFGLAALIEVFGAGFLVYDEPDVRALLGVVDEQCRFVLVIPVFCLAGDIAGRWMKAGLARTGFVTFGIGGAVYAVVSWLNLGDVFEGGPVIPIDPFSPFVVFSVMGGVFFGWMLDRDAAAREETDKTADPPRIGAEDVQ